MNTKKLVLGVAAVLSVAACKAKKTEPKACDRSITAVPQEFIGTAATVGGAVKTSSCSTLAMGTDRDGQPIIMRFGADDKVDASYASPYQPFLALFPDSRFSIIRIAVMPSGYLAMGSYTNPDGASEFFAFKLGEDGLVDNAFGPRGNGVIRREAAPGLQVVDVKPPTVVADGFDVVVDYQGNLVRTVHINYLGRDPLVAPTPLYPIAAACKYISVNSFTDKINYSISQNNCGLIVWSAQGEGLDEELQIVADGTVFKNSFFGDFAMHVEGVTMVVVSHDTLGNLQTESTSVVTGQTTICGKEVKETETHLVFKTSDGTGCRFL